MSSRKQQMPSLTYTFDTATVGNGKLYHTHFQMAPQRLKIANKEIPFHNFGNAFNQRSLLKDKRYRSKVWHVANQKERKSQEKMNRTFYNRPVHMLKEYLDRKEKHSLLPVLSENPETETQQYQQKQFELSKTTNDFRVRKTHKINLESDLRHYESGSEDQIGRLRITEKKQNSDRDFATFQSKNLYEMTIDQLEDSIRWKKQFLNSLTSKYGSDGGKSRK